MNKTQLIDQIAKSTGLTKAKTGHAVNGFLEAIEKALANGENVTLLEFGTFSVKAHNERNGRNPLTGTPITISARKTPNFKASSKLKSSCNP